MGVTKGDTSLSLRLLNIDGDKQGQPKGTPLHTPVPLNTHGAERETWQSGRVRREGWTQRGSQMATPECSTLTPQFIRVRGQPPPSLVRTE